MSRDYGACRFNDGTVLFFVYDGTVDTCDPRLHEEWDDAFATNDSDTSPLYPRPTQAAVTTAEPVEIATWYGKGSHWLGTASRTERTIVNGRKTFVEYDDGTMAIPHDGLPGWADALRPGAYAVK